MRADITVWRQYPTVKIPPMCTKHFAVLTPDISRAPLSLVWTDRHCDQTVALCKGLLGGGFLEEIPLSPRTWRQLHSGEHDAVFRPPAARGRCV